MLGKVVDHMGEVVLAEQETKDSKIAIRYRRGCDSRRNSQCHRRVCCKVGLDWNK